MKRIIFELQRIVAEESYKCGSGLENMKEVDFLKDLVEGTESIADISNLLELMELFNKPN